MPYGGRYRQGNTNTKYWGRYPAPCDHIPNKRVFGLAAIGGYRPSLRPPWLAAFVIAHPFQDCSLYWQLLVAPLIPDLQIIAVSQRQQFFVLQLPHHDPGVNSHFLCKLADSSFTERRLCGEIGKGLFR